MDGSLVLASPLIVTITLATALGLMAITTKLPTRKPFSVMMLLVALYTSFYLFEVTSETIQGMVFWNDLEFMAIESFAPLYMVFMLRFMGRETWMTRFRLAALVAIPISTILLVWTNDLHHLYYASIQMGYVSGIRTMVVEYGPWFWVNTLYLIFGLVAISLVAGQAFISSSRLHRRQVGTTLLAATCPVMAIFVGLAFNDVMPMTYLVVLGLLGLGTLLFLSLKQYDLLDIMPMANDAVVGTIKDGVIVLDLKGRVAYVNGSAMSMLGRRGEGLSSSYAKEALPFLSDRSLSGDEAMVECNIDEDGVTKVLEIHSSSVMNQNGLRTGHLLVLRDVTRERYTTAELELANSKLKLLSDLTKHDIMNHLSVIQGYCRLSEGKVMDPEVRRYLSTILNSAGSIERGVNFANDYQRIGVRAPEWQAISPLLERARAEGDFGDIVFTFSVNGLEVCADPMLERTFFNLMDNSRRHGENVTRITVRSDRRGDGMCLIFEDDGIGIPRVNKDMIFNKGFGKNTGLGLHMAREVLKMTGGSIVETGEEGRGVRFEMVFPSGNWRSSEQGPANTMIGTGKG